MVGILDVSDISNIVHFSVKIQLFGHFTIYRLSLVKERLDRSNEQMEVDSPTLLSC
jgi:hypothetical protein